jgi:hypothetical protein
MLSQEFDSAIVEDLISLVELVLEQDYFTHNNSFYKQTFGLEMGAPTMPILSEIYLQYLEHHSIFKILYSQQTKVYFWYVDDILLFITPILWVSILLYVGSIICIHNYISQ